MSIKTGTLAAIIVLGILSLTTCQHSKANNMAIVSNIRTKLLQDHVLNDYYVHVESRGGAVTISGTASSETAKQAIDNLLSTAYRTTSFTDKMTVVRAPVMASTANNAPSKVGVGTKPPASAHIANTTKEAESPARKQEAAPPTVTLKATPSIITPGKTAVLAWNSQHATSLDIEPGIGRVNREGSRTINPQTNTTYTLTATGPAGQATATAHVNIWNPVPPPRISASANPSKIQKGQSTRLSWSSQDATSVDIEPSVGRVVATGSTIIAPTETTKYTVTATGKGGRQATTATVTVTAPPQPVVVTIPSGTTVEVQMIDSVGSASNQPNDLLRASLAAPIQVNRRLTLPQGTAVYLRVLEIHPSERASRVSEVRLVLDHLVYRGRSYSLHSNAFAVFGLSRYKRRSKEDGITRGRQVHIAPGARISFQLTQPVSIVLPPNDVQDH